MKTLYLWLFKALGCLPLSWLRGLATVLAWMANHKDGATRRVTAKNLQVAFPTISDQQRKNLLAETLQHNIRVLMETPYVWTRAQPHIHQLYDVDDRELAVLRERDQPFLVLAPHIGNWELLGYFLGEHYDNASMYLPSRQGETVDDFIKQARSRFGNRLLPATAEGVRAFYQHLKANHPVSILPDQSPASESGMVYARFFGEIAATIILPAKIARKSRVPTFLGYAVYGETDHRYQIGFRPVAGFGQQPSLTEDVQLMNDAIEQLVCDYPTQYLWTYKRFKRRPSDDPLHARFYNE